MEIEWGFQGLTYFGIPLPYLLRFGEVMFIILLLGYVGFFHILFSYKETFKK